MEKILNSEYKINDEINKIDVNRVTDMLKEAYWSKGIGIDEVKKGITNSALIVTAYTLRDIPVGFSRVISDKTRFAYILDVYVDKSHRKKGIGQGMIDFILKHPELKDVYQWLLATQDAHGVYGKLGFKQLANPEKWMEIRYSRPER